MAAITVKFATPAIVNPGDGTMLVNFDNGSQLQIPADAQGLQKWIAQRVPDLDIVRAMFIANRLAADPMLDSPAVWDGKTCTLDLEQALPGNVFKVL